MKITAAIVLAVVGIGLTTLALFSTKVDTVRAISHHWRIEQQVEDFQARYYEGWDETVPTDAYSTSCNSRQRGSHRQYTGRTCTGTGSNRRCVSNYITVADYDNWCGYIVNRWDYVYSEIAEGDLNTPIVAPEPSTRCTQVEEIGCQRYGAQIQTYSVSFVRLTDSSHFDCSFDRDFWQSLVDGNEYQMIFGTVFNESRCEVQQ